MLHVCFVKKCSGSVSPRGSKVRGSKYDPPQGSKFQSCQNQNLIADLDSSKKSSKRKYSSFFLFLILSGSKWGSKVTSDPNLTSREVKNENTDNQNSGTSFGILINNELTVITVNFRFSQKMSVKKILTYRANLRSGGGGMFVAERAYLRPGELILDLEGRFEVWRADFRSLGPN